MIAFEVPGRPVAITRTRGRPGQYPYKPKEQVSYGNLVKMIAAERMLIAGMAVMEVAVRITVRAVYVVPASWSKKRRDAARWKTSKPDIDNLLKIVKDAMSGVVYRDDALVVEVAAQKVYGLREHMIVEVSPA